VIETTLLLSPVEVGKKLGVTDGTIRELCQRGTLKAVKGPPIPQHPYGTWQIKEEAVLDYLKWRDAPKCKVMDEPTKAYLAGLTDGEGCLTVFITKGRQRGWEGWKTVYYIQIIVKQEKPIRWIKDVTGVGYVFQRKRAREEWCDLWGWKTCNTPACEVLAQILPYLKIKHRQAEIFIQLRDMIKAGSKWRLGSNGTTSLPKEYLFERQKLIDEIHVLNDRTGKRTRMEFTNIA
jgi:hypothetical protein